MDSPAATNLIPAYTYYLTPCHLPQHEIAPFPRVVTVDSCCYGVCRCMLSIYLPLLYWTAVLAVGESSYRPFSTCAAHGGLYVLDRRAPSVHGPVSHSLSHESVHTSGWLLFEGVNCECPPCTCRLRTDRQVFCNWSRFCWLLRSFAD